MPFERSLTDEEKIEFRGCAEAGIKLLGLSRGSTPASAALAVQNYVDGWHTRSQGILSFLFNRRPSIVDASLALGVVWGDQIVKKFSWQWTCVREERTDYYAVASPDRSLVAFPTYFVKACLEDPNVDCKLMLAFNMLEAGSIPHGTVNGFSNLLNGIHRIVPR